MASLNRNNYLNVVASLIVGLHTLEVDLGPDYEFFEKFSMANLPERYEEGIMTPVEPFFFIFNIVALSLAIFTITQLLPGFRDSAMIQDGVKHWYFVAAIAHLLAYAVAVEERGDFVSNLISTIFFAVMAGSTWKILSNQAQAKSDGSSEEFWLLRVPFSLQAGWSIGLTIMSANILVRDAEEGLNFGKFMEVLIVILSLALYAAIPIKMLLFNGPSPNYVVSVMISVVTLGIALNAGDARKDSFLAAMVLVLIYIISFGSLSLAAYMVISRELNEESETAQSDPVEPLSDTAYVGSEMKSDVENVESQAAESQVVKEKAPPVPVTMGNILNVVAAYVMALYTANIDLEPEYEFFSKFNLWVFAARYEQGAMTPAQPFFFIFIAVALFTTVFGVVQVLPIYRATPMVRAVGNWFFVAVVAQILGYVIGDDGQDNLVVKSLSTFCFAVMAISVWIILNKQSRCESDGSLTEFWFLRFPFSLYAGWSIVVVLMSACTIFVKYEDYYYVNAGAHIGVIIVALAVYGGVSMKLLLGEARSHVVPLVLAVASFGIAMDPAEEKDDQWASMLFLLLGFLIAFLSFLVYNGESGLETYKPTEPTKGTYEGAEVPSTKAADNGTMV